MRYCFSVCYRGKGYFEMLKLLDKL
ncbi:MAG: hypothetical protein UV41_C0002G0019, partial [Candidatus Daviesbacteria bacterium GW2011_GWA2_42_7]